MTLPAPLTPPDSDLRDFTFMPLDVARFAQSDLVAFEEPAAVVGALLLWGASWHQTPAGSLTDDDRALARHAGYGRAVAEFLLVKEAALRGFIKCSDGRLYHPVVAEKANIAWEGKLKQRHKTYCASIRKHNERNPDAKIDTMTFTDWVDAGQPEGATKSKPVFTTVPPLGGRYDEEGRAIEPGHAYSEDRSRVTDGAVTRDNYPMSHATASVVARDDHPRSHDPKRDGLAVQSEPNPAEAVGMSENRDPEAKNRLSRVTEQHVTRDTPPMSRANAPSVTRETTSKGEGEGERKGEEDYLGLDAKSDQADGGPPSPTEKPRRQSLAGTLLPGDWALPPEWCEWACTARGWTAVDAAAEARIFANHWHGKAGQDAKKRDWFATWRNWVERSRRTPTAGTRSDGATIGTVRMNSPC